MADIFHVFRVVCMRKYWMDRAHYESQPNFGWEAMLRHNYCTLDLILDQDNFSIINISGSV